MSDLTPPVTFSTDDIVETVRAPLLVLSVDLRVRLANRSFYRTFHVTAEQTLNRLVYELGDRQWDIPAVRTLLEEVLPKNTSFDNYEVTHDFESLGKKVMLVNGRRIDREHNHTQFVLLAFEDITERRRAEDELAIHQEWQRVTLKSVVILNEETRLTVENP